jgi:hypothetical protein
MTNDRQKHYDNSIPPEFSSAFPHRANRKANRKLLRAPRGEPWVWISREMLDSAIWRSLPFVARKVLDRLIVEHLRHAGRMNGHLTVTYDDFKKWGVRRESVPEAIEILVEGGYIRVKRGKFEAADRRRPNKYTLTWLSADLEAPTNDFRRASAERVRHLAGVHRASRRQTRARRERYAA